MDVNLCTGTAKRTPVQGIGQMLGFKIFLQITNSTLSRSLCDRLILFTWPKNGTYLQQNGSCKECNISPLCPYLTVQRQLFSTRFNYPSRFARDSTLCYLFFFSPDDLKKYMSKQFITSR